jgi:hypothetical protein
MACGVLNQLMLMAEQSVQEISAWAAVLAFESCRQRKSLGRSYSFLKMDALQYSAGVL